MIEDKIIAQWLKAHGWESLGYAASPTCPQGHGSQMAHEHSDYDDHDEWGEDPQWGVGALCLTCIVVQIQKRRFLDNFFYDYDEAKGIRRQYQNDPTYHPEWRVEGVPLDFTNPAHLIPAVEAFCDTTKLGFRFDYYPKSDSQPRGWYEAGPIVKSDEPPNMYAGGTILLWRHALAAAIVETLNPFSPPAYDGENDEKGEH